MVQLLYDPPNEIIKATQNSFPLKQNVIIQYNHELEGTSYIGEYNGNTLIDINSNMSYSNILEELLECLSTVVSEEKFLNKEFVKNKIEKQVEKKAIHNINTI